MEKAVFIGLGGSGVKTVGHLKARLLQHHGDLPSLNESCAFLFLDTDENDRALLRSRYGQLPQLRGADFTPAAEWIDMGGVNPHAAYVKAKASPHLPANAHFLSWADERGITRLKDALLHEGAGGNRQQGRVALWQNWTTIQARLNSAFDSLAGVAAKGAPLRAVYVFSGTCGGTGSSAVLDLLYLVRVTSRGAFPLAGDIHVRLVLFMPYPHVRLYREKGAPATRILEYEANAHALFSELDEVLAHRRIDGDGTPFHHAAAHPHGVTINLDPFASAFCVDTRTDGGTLIPEDAVYRNTAEFFYHWQLADGPNSVTQSVDNLTPEADRHTRQVAAFSTLGFRALCFPEELLREYVGVRFLFELFDAGLLGQDYERAVPDPGARSQEVREAFDRCIGAFLFQGQAPAADPPPNLERKVRGLIGSYEQSIVDDRFVEQYRVLILGPMREGPTKTTIKDEGLLDSLINDADAVARDLEHKLDEEFRTSDTSREALVRMACVGRDAPSGPQPGIEDWLEDLVVRLGLRSAVDFARRLDTACAARLSDDRARDDLEDRRTSLQGSLARLAGQIAAARTECLRKGDKDSLDTLLGLLRQKLRTRGELRLVEQQIQVLKDLCEGERGRLDHYVRRLSALVSAAANRVEGEDGLRDAFLRHLPKRFAETSQDVTTTYLPDVAGFVKEGAWIPDADPAHVFARLYGGLVPQDAGGPRRHGENAGRGPKPEGLQAILREMLTTPEATGGRRYEHGRSLAYFRQVFGLDGTTPETTLLGDLSAVAERYVHRAAAANREIAQEQGRSLHDRVAALSAAERQQLQRRFSDDGTRAFCPMNAPSGMTNALYRGADPALAETLGYIKGARYTFDADSDPTRMVRAKVVTGYRLSDYADASALGNAYETWHRQATEGGATAEPFTPHIHSLLNRFGVALGFRMAAKGALARAGGAGHRSFAMLYLYRHLLETARSTRRELADSVVSPSSDLASPLRLDPSPAGGAPYTAVLCHSFDLDASGLPVLRRTAETTLSFPGVLSHWHLWGHLAGSADSWVKSVQSYDSLVRQKLHAEWKPLFDGAMAALLRSAESGLKVSADKAQLADMHAFYAAFKKAIEEVRDDLGKTVERPAPRASVTSRVPGEVGPAVEM